MANSEILNSKSGIYPVQKWKNTGLKGMLFGMAVYLLFLGVQIFSYAQDHQSFGPVLDRYQGQFIFFISMFLFGIFVTSKINDKLPNRFEVHLNGITQVDRYGNSLTIHWDEIENIKKGQGLRKLGIECPTLKKRMFIPGHMNGYQELSGLILAEYQKRQGLSKPSGQIFVLTPSGKRSYWIFGGIFTLFTLACIVSEVHLQSSDNTDLRNPFVFQCGMILGILMFGLFTYFLFLQAVRISGKRLELNEQGITQLDKKGNRVFIGWDEIDSLKPTRFEAATIFLRDSSGQIKIPIFQGYENYTELKERICEEFMNHLKVQSFPVVLDCSRIIRQVITLVILFCVLYGVGYLILFKTDKSIPGNLTSGLFILTFLFIGFAFLISFMFRKVQKVTVDTPGVTLHRLAGNQFISWENLDNLEWKAPKEGVGDTAYFSLQITDKNGKTYKIQDSIDFLLRIYAIVKKKI